MRSRGGARPAARRARPRPGRGAGRRGRAGARARRLQAVVAPAPGLAADGRISEERAKTVHEREDSLEAHRMRLLPRGHGARGRGEVAPALARKSVLAQRLQLVAGGKRSRSSSPASSASSSFSRSKRRKYSRTRDRSMPPACSSRSMSARSRRRREGSFDEACTLRPIRSAASAPRSVSPRTACARARSSMARPWLRKANRKSTRPRAGSSAT